MFRKVLESVIPNRQEQSKKEAIKPKSTPGATSVPDTPKIVSTPNLFLLTPSPAFKYNIESNEVESVPQWDLPSPSECGNSTFSVYERA